MEEEGRGLGTLKTKPTCSITAWVRGWGEEQEEEGSPTQEGEEEVAEGEEEGHLSPQV